MNEEQCNEGSGHEPEQMKIKKAKLPGEGGPAEVQSEAQKKLTAEEQMALYEKDLKENDWGHQPC